MPSEYIHTAQLSDDNEEQEHTQNTVICDPAEVTT